MVVRHSVAKTKSCRKRTYKKEDLNLFRCRVLDVSLQSADFVAMGLK